jgi:dTDP-glucose 4,6-dehydratase
MNILVTGGCGFIGSHFIRMLLQETENKIINLDKLTYAGNLDNTKDFAQNKNYSFIKGDICDKPLVEKIVSGSKIDAVIHFAAESVSKDVYLPIWCHGKIEILTLAELFERIKQYRKSKIRLKNGVEVVDFSHKDYKALAYKGGIGYWMPIKQISRHKYKGTVVRLTQKWGEVTVTPNHAIYDIDFRLTTPTKNPEMLGLRNINHVPKRINWNEYSGARLKALLRIFAAYISEGWTTFNKKNGSYHFGVANKDRAFIQSLFEDLQLLGYKPNITKTKDGLYQLVVSNKALFNFVRKNAGFGSRNKFVPPAVFQLRTEFQEEFIRVLVAGDGEIIRNKNYDTLRYTTTSNKLATGMSLLFVLLGHNFSVSRDNRFMAYTFRWSGDYTVSLLSKQYEEIDYDDYVYDISVEGFENFVCGVGNIVVHNTHVDRSIIEAGDFVRTDVLGTYVLLEATKKFGLRRMLFVSTDEVYGSIQKGFFTEQSPFAPNSPYSASKAGADLLVRAYYKTHGLDVVITRSSNNYGPYQHPEKLIPRFITNLLCSKKVPLYGSGLNVRDWLYVTDNCKGIWVAFEKGAAGEAYNIGGDCEKTNLEITTRILSLLGKDDNWIERVPDRKGHDFRYALDSSKMHKLGWKPETDFEKGMRETVHWYKNNEWWWKKLVE